MRRILLSGRELEKNKKSNKDDNVIMLLSLSGLSSFSEKNLD